MPGVTPIVATFSIVAFDPANGDLGVAVQSRFFAVGAVVPWVRAGVGAVATQAGTNTSYGPRGLDMMAAGRDGPATLTALVQDDPAIAVRQVGLVDAQGRAAAHTGPDCMAWAGHETGKHFTAQGNILVGPEVVSAMASAFAAADGDLAERLLATLRAGQAAGGDRRGMQSAAMQVARANAGYNGWTDRFVDLRVDDHPSPIEELARLLALQRNFHSHMQPKGPVRLDADSLPIIRRALRRAGYLHEDPQGSALDPATRAALTAFADSRGDPQAAEALAEGSVPGPVFQALLAAMSGRRPAS